MTFPKMALFVNNILLDTDFQRQMEEVLVSSETWFLINVKGEDMWPRHVRKH